MDTLTITLTFDNAPIAIIPADDYSDLITRLRAKADTPQRAAAVDAIISRLHELVDARERKGAGRCDA
jgi:hypothetical protein